jgi:hypothetical protein
MKKYMLLLLLALPACNDEPDIQESRNDILKVYPNPCLYDAIVSVNNASNTDYILEIFDAKGSRIVKKTYAPGNTETYVLHLDGKPNGTYHASVSTGQSVMVKEFLKVSK